MPVVDLLQWIAVSRKTGTLIVRGEWKRRIFFDEGCVTLVASDNRRERLGHYLVGWGYLTEEQLDELLAEQQQRGKMIGDLLVENGIVPRDELVRMLRARAEDMITALVLSGEGDFRFIDHTIPSRASIEVRFTVEQLLFEAARQADEVRRIRRLVPNSQVVPVIRDESFVEGLSPHERAICSRLDGCRNIERAALAARVPEFQVLSVVYRGVVAGAFELRDDADTSAPPPVSLPWADLLREAETCLTFGDLLAAYGHLAAVRREFAASPEPMRRAEAMLIRLEDIVDRARESEQDLLQLAANFDDLTKLKFTPEEAFIISRVDGRYTISQTLAQFPGDRLLGKLIVHELLQQGIFKLSACKSVARTTS